MLDCIIYFALLVIWVQKIYHKIVKTNNNGKEK